jgi:quinol monooxygenase YgiN
MAYVVAATWKAKAGAEKIIAGVIEAMTPLSRQEPGCLLYQAHRSLDDPRTFFIYEQYVDASGYEAHMATEHFHEYVRGRATPHLESRERAYYETIDL